MKSASFLEHHGPLFAQHRLNAIAEPLLSDRITQNNPTNFSKSFCFMRILNENMRTARGVHVGQIDENG